jgi:hypothetical protein
VFAQTTTKRVYGVSVPASRPAWDLVIDKGIKSASGLVDAETGLRGQLLSLALTFDSSLRAPPRQKLRLSVWFEPSRFAHVCSLFFSTGQVTPSPPRPSARDARKEVRARVRGMGNRTEQNSTFGLFPSRLRAVGSGHGGALLQKLHVTLHARGWPGMTDP